MTRVANVTLVSISTLILVLAAGGLVFNGTTVEESSNTMPSVGRNFAEPESSNAKSESNSDLSDVPDSLYGGKENKARDNGHSATSFPLPKAVYVGFIVQRGEYTAFLERKNERGELIATTVIIGDYIYDTKWRVLNIDDAAISIKLNETEHDLLLSNVRPQNELSEDSTRNRRYPVDPIDGMIHDPVYGLIDPNNPDPDEGVNDPYIASESEINDAAQSIQSNAAIDFKEAKKRRAQRMKSFLRDKGFPRNQSPPWPEQTTTSPDNSPFRAGYFSPMQ